MVLALAALVGATAPTAAQPPDVAVVPVLTDATRIESWSFFTPRTADADPDYTLTGNRATLGVAAATRHVEGYGAFQYAQLLNLPSKAFAPGVFGTAALGPGAFYFDAARAPNAYQLYFKALSLRVRNLPGGLSIEAGRMAFESAAEARPASTAVAALRRERLEGRLIGEADWTPFERAFDGVRADAAGRHWHATAALFFPSQGAYEESANATISRVRVVTASLTYWTSSDRRPDVGPIGRAGRRLESWLTVDDSDARRAALEAQAFVQRYRDRRADKLPPDNSLSIVKDVDLDVETYGGSLIALRPLGRGRVDAVGWLARQSGGWYGLDHRAWSGVLEAGYAWLDAPWQPWIRAGITYASGDDDPGDRQHGTFFPPLPTAAPALLAGTFAQMNLRDVVGELRLRPRPRMGITGAVHQLSLPALFDRWYSGTGATAARGAFFGYAGRFIIDRDLGTLEQVTIDAVVSKRWRLRGSLGVMQGGPARLATLAGDRLTVIAVESLLAF
jgi:hypothetical protein